MRRIGTLVVAGALLATACGGDDEDSASATSAATIPTGPGTTAPPVTMAAGSRGIVGVTLEAETVVRRADEVVFVTAPEGDDRLFLVERDGRIGIVRDGERLVGPFLDIADKVTAAGLEQGLLGLAFHPRYPLDGRFYVDFTDPRGDTRIVEYRVSDDPDRADPGSARILLIVDQPAGNHNGGMLQFGPDGYLYVGLGDGGAANDRFGNGQRSDTLLGTILRLDVDAAEPYSIPPDNPFVGGGGAAEVWAYGLRNPWRFDIDPATALIYIGDVGQDAVEEINAVPWDAAGVNYGWPVLEGDDCFADDGCDPADFQGPVHSYRHGEGCSVIGGFAYRGLAMPTLHGHYFYGDWCGGWVRSFRVEGGRAVDHRDWSADLGTIGQVTSFGMDGFGELYVTTTDGLVLKLVPRG